jgi:tetratricopeptide (TPR) repeat protein
MTRASWWLLGVLALAFPMGTLASPAQAQQKLPQTTSGEPLTEDQQKAQQHFQRAKDLYAAGNYREAVGELEAARALDPKAKDLVFNLGIVSEKLAKFDEAIAYFRQYIEMEGVTSAEKQKAESIIKRIEGAKTQVPTTPTASASSTTGPTQPPPEPKRGRVDGLTIAAAAVAVVGLGVGVGFGIRALSTRPSGFVTGRDGTFDDLKSRTDDAHTSAIISDVGFTVGVVAAIAATYLFFGRYKDPDPSLKPMGLGGTFQ